MCGKDDVETMQAAMQMGSPPRVRERHFFIETVPKWFRITPACAGKTQITSWSGDFGEDHPRVCGKDASKLGKRSYKMGSPPRVRERLPRMPKLTLRARITPACAGKTSKSKVILALGKDHPRVCGTDLRISCE